MHVKSPRTYRKAPKAALAGASLTTRPYVFCVCDEERGAWMEFKEGGREGSLRRDWTVGEGVVAQRFEGWRGLWKARKGGRV